MKKQGFSIHCHHNILVEWCYDYDEIVEAIKKTKAENEQETRLKLFKILPDEALKEIPQSIIKAYTEWYKASAEWEKAYAEWQKAYAEWKEESAEWNKAPAEWYKASAEWYKASAEWKKASAEWQKAYDEWSIEDKNNFHQKWCGCKEWDGKEIVFPNKEKK